MRAKLFTLILGLFLQTSACLAQAGIGEMQTPIDNLFEAWRQLDTRLYIAQWAPNAVKIDNRNGARQGPPALLADRTRLFGQLAFVDVQYVPSLESSRGNEATFRVSYSLVLHYKSGRRVPDRACETYRVQERGGVWLIVENVDYAPCR